MIFKNKKEKSLLAPLGLVEKEEYYQMGDRFLCNLTVTQLPKNFYLGMLNYYVSNPSIKVHIKTYPLDIDIQKSLRKEYLQKEQEWQKTVDPTNKQRLQNELQSHQEFINETVSYNDKAYNYLMVFVVKADTLHDLRIEKKQLRSQLTNAGFKVATLPKMQIPIFKLVTPIFMDKYVELNETIKYNLGVPITSRSIAGMYPYIFETLKDEKGFLYAREMNTSGVIIWDPFYYTNNPKQAKLNARLNGNIVVLGTSGSGKTTDISSIFRYGVREKVKIIWIDPENKNIHLTNKYGGSFVNWGGENAKINPFDLKLVDSDEDESINMYDTKLALFNAIDEFKNILSLYSEDIQNKHLALVGDLMLDMYAKKGINFETDMRTLSSEQYPILMDFYHELLLQKESIKNKGEQKIRFDLLEELSIIILPMLNEHSIFFNGHTTVKTNMNENSIISFGTKVLFNKQKNLRDTLNYMMFRFAWNLCLKTGELSMFIIDEAHTMINEGRSAIEISQFTRRSRKYDNITVIGTQETTDFTDPNVITHGKAIFNNCAYKIVKKLNKNSIDSLGELITLNENEKGLIEELQQGESLFICGDKRIPTYTILTEKEEKVMLHGA